MRCVSDNGATAPISALTYAFSIGPGRGFEADDSEARIIAGLPLVSIGLTSRASSTALALMSGDKPTIKAGDEAWTVLSI